jgi:hypothetical protein
MFPTFEIKIFVKIHKNFILDIFLHFKPAISLRWTKANSIKQQIRKLFFAVSTLLQNASE